MRLYTRPRFPQAKLSKLELCRKCDLPQAFDTGNILQRQNVDVTWDKQVIILWKVWLLLISFLREQKLWVHFCRLYLIPSHLFVERVKQYEARTPRQTEVEKD